VVDPVKIASAELLEFDALKRLLLRYVSSPLGRLEIEKVQPGVDRAALEETLAQTGEAIEYLQSASRPHPAARGAAVRLHFDTLREPAQALGKLRLEGACLEAAESRELTELLDVAADIRRLLLSVAQRFPRLGALAEKLGEFSPLVRDLAGKILPDGTVVDHATPELARLRRDTERQRVLIQESLERFLRSHREADVLQEEFVTIRNERFVVPVIAGRQKKIEGVIHASSGSGHTLFVEPLETIELNNDLVRLTEEELREVHRILREMTARLRQSQGPIQRTAAVLAELELLFAKADFALDFGCVIPSFSPPEARRLRLRDARHPLLEDVLRRQKRPIVPVSLALDDECRTLLISGPNTGGKTVTMKTVGLLALMAQSGLPVPCLEAEFPIFGQVLADIGDNQSIQESLSTFSAHIARVREMLDAADSGSLVLLDELGRATDPEEGGALGVAVIEHFRATGAFTLASTHLLALKIYGAGVPGVTNASMGFDDRTLEPTYVLMTGAPGKSAGLEIARHLGMPEHLIDEARQRLGSRERDVAVFLSELHQRLEDVSGRERELREQTASLAAREQALTKQWSDRESAKLKELDRRCDLVLERFEEQARETLAGILQEPERKKSAGGALRQVARLKRELREEMEVTVLSTRSDSRGGVLERPKIVEGARVRLSGVRAPARVRRLLDGGRIEVEAGFMKLQIPADDVLEVLPDAPGVSLPQKVSFDAAPLVSGAVEELNLIGQRAEEAIDHVEKFLDTAILADVTQVRIVHGHGMGILRRAVAEYLAKHPNVAKSYPAEQNQGGAGATIVELKG
jgi:DNA mismatch repair protein MutS2